MRKSKKSCDHDGQMCGQRGSLSVCLVVAGGGLMQRTAEIEIKPKVEMKREFCND